MVRKKCANCGHQLKQDNIGCWKHIHHKNGILVNPTMRCKEKGCSCVRPLTEEHKVKALRKQYKPWVYC